jgi:hypothetical protein
MKTSHQSTKKCKYRTSEKYSITYYKNTQNINHACACHIYLMNSIILFYLLSNINFDIWIGEGGPYCHLGFKSKVLPGPLPDLSA